MKTLLARPRVLLALLLAVVPLALGSVGQANPASAEPIGVEVPLDVLCIDAEGVVTHCPPTPCPILDPLTGVGADPCPIPPGPILIDPPIDFPPVVRPAPVPSPARRLPAGVLAVKDFTAFVNAQPGPGALPKLIVTGTVTVTSPAASVRLTLPQTQGINPRILLLDVKVTRLPRIVPQVARDVPVRFESTNFVDLDEVNIPAFGLRLPVSVAV
jgi:hypothetical protein